MMKRTFTLRRFLAATLLASGLLASGSVAAESLNCVQFVQKNTRIGLHGDAWQWWDQAAADHFGRGAHPQAGAIMVFSKTGLLPHGHVAVVRNVRNSRTLVVDHANWSPIRGHRGQVERAAEIIDVSPNNDWSRVRVWYQPTAEIGQTVYAIRGFVYPAGREPTHHAR